MKNYKTFEQSLLRFINLPWSKLLKLIVVVMIAAIVVAFMIWVSYETYGKDIASFHVFSVDIK